MCVFLQSKFTPNCDRNEIFPLAASDFARKKQNMTLRRVIIRARELIEKYLLRMISFRFLFSDKTILHTKI